MSTKKTMSTTTYSYPAGTVAYTDGSRRRGVSSAAAALIISDSKFERELTKVFSEKYNIYRIELEGVILALEYLAANEHRLPKPFYIRTDCESIVAIYNRKQDSDGIPVRVNKTRWDKIFKIGGELNVVVEYIRGHQLTANPNVECDKLVRVLSGWGHLVV